LAGYVQRGLVPFIEEDEHLHAPFFGLEGEINVFGLCGALGRQLRGHLGAFVHFKLEFADRTVGNTTAIELGQDKGALHELFGFAVVRIADELVPAWFGGAFSGRLWLRAVTGDEGEGEEEQDRRSGFHWCTPRPTSVAPSGRLSRTTCRMPSNQDAH